jgi:hypothetical protein
MTFSADDINQTLDASGLRCPEPVMMVRKTVRLPQLPDILAGLRGSPCSFAILIEHLFIVTFNCNTSVLKTP